MPSSLMFGARMSPNMPIPGSHTPPPFGQVSPDCPAHCELDLPTAHAGSIDHKSPKVNVAYQPSLLCFPLLRPQAPASHVFGDRAVRIGPLHLRFSSCRPALRSKWSAFPGFLRAARHLGIGATAPGQTGTREARQVKRKHNTLWLQARRDNRRRLARPRARPR